MGCDIDVWIEFRTDATEEWQLDPNHLRGKDDEIGLVVASFPFPRTYELFCLISECGRGDHHPCYKPRGWPSDVNSNEAWLWEVYAYPYNHGKTWLTLEQWKEIQKEHLVLYPNRDYEATLWKGSFDRYRDDNYKSDYSQQGIHGLICYLEDKVTGWRSALTDITDMTDMEVAIVLGYLGRPEVRTLVSFNN